jgi:hypothetical protein
MLVWPASTIRTDVVNCLWALPQRQKIIFPNAVSVGLQKFVAGSTRTHTNPGGGCAFLGIKAVLLALMVTDEEAAAIRAVYERDGELSAAIELRRLFLGITDNTQARACARTIAGWQPLLVKPLKKPTVSSRGRSRGRGL